MRIYHCVSQVFEQNTYIIVNEKNQALIVDPGAGTKPYIEKILHETNSEIKAVLVTHAHPDHVWDASKLGDIPVYVPKPDLYRMQNPLKYLSEDLSKRIQDIVKEEFVPAKNIVVLPDETYTTAFEIIEKFYLRAIPTPGHTEGSSVFLFASEIVDCSGMNIKTSDNLYAFCGDVIFEKSVGRTDLHGGDRQQMLQSLRTIANIVDPRTMLLTGHGKPVVLQQAKLHNEHLKYAMRVG